MQDVIKISFRALKLYYCLLSHLLVQMDGICLADTASYKSEPPKILNSTSSVLSLFFSIIRRQHVFLCFFQTMLQLFMCSSCCFQPGSAQHLPRAVGRLRPPTSHTCGTARTGAAATNRSFTTTTGVAEETLQTQRGRVAWVKHDSP